MTYAKPTNDYEAFVMALKLAISAPTDEQFDKALEMAESIAPSLNEIEIARAKQEAAA